MRATFRPIMHAWSFKFSELLYHARTYHDLRYQNWTPPPPPHKKTLGTCCYTPNPHKKPSELVAIPPLLTKKPSALVVIPPLLTKTPRNLLLYPPPSSQKKPGTCCLHIFTTSVFHKKDSMPPPFTHKCYIFVEAFGWFLSKLLLFLWYSFLLYVYMYLNV